MSKNGFKKWKKEHESLYSEPQEGQLQENETSTANVETVAKAPAEDNISKPVVDALAEEKAPRNRRQRRENLQNKENNAGASKEKIENYKAEMFKLINEMKDGEEEDDTDGVEGLLDEKELLNAEKPRNRKTSKAEERDLSDLLHNLDNSELYKSDKEENEQDNTSEAQTVTMPEPTLINDNTDLQQPRVRTVKTPIKKGHHKMAAPIGLVVIILALVGIVSLIISGVNGVKYLLDDEDTKRAYDTMLDPVVMLDPRPFKTIEDADPAMLTEISLRMTLMADEKGEKYPMDDQGMMSIPLTDIEAQCKKTFGENAKLQTGDLDKGEIIFKFDAPTNSYIVPVMGEMGYYKAYVEKIKKLEKNKYELTVGYIPSSVEWGEDKQGNKVPPKPEKYMTYVLEGDKDNQIITSIQQPVDLNLNEESK